MKINNYGVNESNLRLRGNSAARTKSTSTGTGSSNKAQETVAISNQARMLGAAKTAMSEVSDVRMERVQPIKNSLDSGQYKVDSQKVADRIIRNALSNE